MYNKLIFLVTFFPTKFFFVTYQSVVKYNCHNVKKLSPTTYILYSSKQKWPKKKSKVSSQLIELSNKIQLKKKKNKERNKLFSFDLYEYKKLVHKLKKKKSKKKRKREESRIKIVLIKTILQLYRYQKNNNSKLRAKKKKKQNILTHLKCSAKYFFFF